MSTRLVLVVLAIGVTVGASAREPEATREKKDAADKLFKHVADLGSDEYAVREAALEALEAAGFAARPALERALLSTDPEIRRQAREMIARLARRQQGLETLDPKRLRLAYREVPLSFAIQDFARLTGCRIVLDPAIATRLGEKAVTLDTGFTTFWDALEQFCRAAGLTEKQAESGPAEAQIPYLSKRIFRGGMAEVANPYRRSTSRTLTSTQITLTEGDPLTLPSYHTGALRIRVLPPGTPLGTETMTRGDREVFLALEVTSEPTASWQGVQSVRIDKAVDDKGQLLVQPHAYHNLPATARQYEEMMLWESSYYPGSVSSTVGGGELVPVRLRLGTKNASLATEVRGTASVRLQTPPIRVATLDNVLASVEKSVKGTDGTNLRLLEVQREENGQIRLRIQIENPQPENANMVWGWRRWGFAGGVEGGLRNLALYDANGHLVRQVSAEHLDDGTGGPMDYRVTFQPVTGQAEPSQLVLEGRRTTTVDVPFVLKNVPLR